MNQPLKSPVLRKVNSGRTQAYTEDGYKWGDYQEGDWVYGHGAGASDDPMVKWKHNKKTGYSEYYDYRNGYGWSGYNIA